MSLWSVSRRCSLNRGEPLPFLPQNVLVQKTLNSPPFPKHWPNWVWGKFWFPTLVFFWVAFPGLKCPAATEATPTRNSDYIRSCSKVQAAGHFKRWSGMGAGWGGFWTPKVSQSLHNAHQCARKNWPGSTFTSGNFESCAKSQIVIEPRTQQMHGRLDAAVMAGYGPVYSRRR